MKNASMLLVMALIVGTGQLANGHDPSTEGKEAQLRRDQLHAAVQAICPVSGEKLGEHGPPIKVTVGKNKQEIFVCCKACLKEKIDAKHWGTIHANFAKAQRICPVMKKPLPKNPKWTIVKGQIVYVCCPPCTKKIAADPHKWLPQVDALYSASLRSKKPRR
ncbi:MAG: hypothetical protein IH899_13840 [Planctomycetes bacterium]|nr:hypothetical protein [Planctomycetota bacterium]